MWPISSSEDLQSTHKSECVVDYIESRLSLFDIDLILRLRETANTKFLSFHISAFEISILPGYCTASLGDWSPVFWKHCSILKHWAPVTLWCGTISQKKKAQQHQISVIMDYPITICLEQMWYSTKYPDTDRFL